MAETTVRKNPLLAASLSAIVMGTGHFYLRNPLKALSYMALMATLIVAQVHADRAEHHVIIALLMSAFYFFQIFDAYQDATDFAAQPASALESAVEPASALPSLGLALVLIVAGIVLQLGNLDVWDLDLSDIVDLWPLILIFLGLKMATKSKNKEH